MHIKASGFIGLDRKMGNLLHRYNMFITQDVPPGVAVVGERSEILTPESTHFGTEGS